MPPLTVKFQDGFDTAAKLFLVALFFAFPIALGAANTLMALVLLSWLLAGRFGQRWETLKRNLMTLPALLMYGLIAAGVVYTTATPQEIWMHLNKYSKFLFVLVAISLLHEARWRERCWQAFSAAMLFTLASVYAGIWLDLPWSVTHNKGWGVDHTVFKDYISQGVMMSFFVVLSLQRAIAVTSKGRCILWAAIALLGILSITHLSGGRTGYLSLGAALLVFSLMSVPSRWRISAFVGLVLATALMVGTSPQLRGRVAQALAEAEHHSAHDFSSIGQRLYFWRRAAGLIEERPVLGWGTGAYHRQFCRVADDQGWCGAGRFHPHNQFLFFGVEYGLVGLLAFLFYLARPIRHAVQQDRPQKAMILSFMAIFVMGSMTHGSLWLSTENHFFTFMLALLMAGPAWCLVEPKAGTTTA